MSKAGTKYILDGCSQKGIAKNGEEIIIPLYAIVVKIKDSFADRIKFRNMFVIENTDQEVSIDQSIIERYFREVKDGENH